MSTLVVNGQIIPLNGSERNFSLSFDRSSGNREVSLWNPNHPANRGNGLPQFLTGGFGGHESQSFRDDHAFVDHGPSHIGGRYDAQPGGSSQSGGWMDLMTQYLEAKIAGLEQQTFVEQPAADPGNNFMDQFFTAFTDLLQGSLFTDSAADLPENQLVTDGTEEAAMPGEMPEEMKAEVTTEGLYESVAHMKALDEQYAENKTAITEKQTAIDAQQAVVDKQPADHVVDVEMKQLDLLNSEIASLEQDKAALEEGTPAADDVQKKIDTKKAKQEALTAKLDGYKAEQEKLEQLKAEKAEAEQANKTILIEKTDLREQIEQDYETLGWTPEEYDEFAAEVTPELKVAQAEEADAEATVEETTSDADTDESVDAAA